MLKNTKTFDSLKGNEIQLTFCPVDFHVNHSAKQEPGGGQSDNRYLWPEYFRIIQDIEPTFVVGENVDGILTMENGAIFNGICNDLESTGYQVETFTIPACAVGGEHVRNRTWFVAYPNGYGS